jgi:simple sugar transport system permease protein
VAFKSGNVYLGILAACIVGIGIGALQGLFTVTLRCNQVVYGVAMNIFALSLTTTLYRGFFTSTIGERSCPGLPKIQIPGLERIPYIGNIFSNQTLLFYIAIGFLVVSVIVFKYTSAGLKIKAVGENPHAADTLGVSVFLTRYMGLIISGLFGALGGAALTVGDMHIFQENMSAGRGYIALAAVIFSRYKPAGVLIAAFLFGIVDALQLRLQVIAQTGLTMPYQLFLALPYIVTILALFIVGKSVAPKYHTKPFIRGER